MRLAFWRPRKATQPRVMITPAPAFIERALIAQQTSVRVRRRRIRRYCLLALTFVAATIGWHLTHEKRTTSVLIAVPADKPATPVVPERPSRPPNVPTIAPTARDSACEWVRPFTKANGIEVKGYFRSKPGQGCPLDTGSQQIYVGPRGGRYHYSKSGKKVYEHK